MQTFYDAVFVAPHLDDAALSCGGQIYGRTQKGDRILVVTVMAGDAPPTVSDYAQSLHQRWDLPLDATAARRWEDTTACTLLGADALHWSIADCIYRLNPATGRSLYNSDQALFGPMHPVDDRLVDAVAELFLTLPPHRQIIAPLGVGHHVDHQITRQAAERCFGSRLLFYEDYPYVQTEGSLDFLQQAANDAWQATVIPLDSEALAVKIEAVLAYRSQLSTFFENRADLEQQLGGYAQSVGGERLWQKNAP